MEGLALLRTSFVALYGEKEPETGLRLALQAGDTTRSTSKVLAGLAVRHAAEAHAMLGRRGDCERALADAEAWFERVDDSDAAIELFSPSQHGRLAGSCYLFLDNPKRARPILANTADMPGGRSKSHAIVLGNLALACMLDGRLDEATATLHRAIDVVETTWG